MTNDAVETASRLLHSARPTRKVSIDQSDLQDLIDVAISIQAEIDAAVAAESAWADSLAETLFAVNSQHGGKNAARLLKDFRDHRARGNADPFAEHDARVRAEALREAALKMNYMRQDAAEVDSWEECSAYEAAEEEILALIPDTEKGGE